MADPQRLDPLAALDLPRSPAGAFLVPHRGCRLRLAESRNPAHGDGDRDACGADLLSVCALAVAGECGDGSCRRSGLVAFGRAGATAGRGAVVAVLGAGAG